MKKLLYIILIAALLILIVMLLWNAILPELFGVNEVTYWQAAGLYVLGNILFKQHKIIKKDDD